MKQLRYITMLMIPILLMGLTALGKTQPKYKKHFLKDFSIGFYRGVTVLDVSKGIDKPARKQIASTTGFSVGFPIINQFRAEVGLSMNNILQNNNSQNNNLSLKRNNFVSIPVSVQYYLLPKKSKIQPYFGFGAMIVPDAQKYIFVKDGDGIKLMQGTSNISLLITQGVNIEINTKIHLTESLHIISSEGKTNFGLNFGVTLYVP